jgi:hypothetical protein
MAHSVVSLLYNNTPATDGMAIIARTRNPTGKSPGCSRRGLSSPIRKNILIFRRPKSPLYPPPSRPTRGALAIVTDAGRDAVDASGASDERARLRLRQNFGGRVPGPAKALAWTVRGRRSRVVLTPHGWRQVGSEGAAGDGDKKA